MEQILFAGTPAYTSPGGIFCVTSDKAPITEFSPIVTPGIITLLTPTKTLLPIVTSSYTRFDPYFSQIPIGPPLCVSV